MKKFSFSRLLRNDRVMLIVSVVLSVGLWYFVLSGSTNVTTRTITCKLSTTNVHNGTLQVIEKENLDVVVEVQGAWSDITSLTADDIRVQLNAADIQSVGSCRIQVLASRNSQASGYDILSVSPSSVTLFCDEWTEGRIFTMASGAVSAAAPGISAEGDTRDIGSVTISEEALPGGVVAVQGPQSVVDKISQLVARVSEETTITEQQIFKAGVMALDADGNEVDLQFCTLRRYAADPSVDPTATFTDMAENVLDVLVTVKERREITFTYEVQNAPGKVDLSQIITVKPGSVTLEGEKELLEMYAETLSRLPAINFDTLTTAEKARAIPIALPDGITVVGDTTGLVTVENGQTMLNVTLEFDWTGYTKRTINWNIGQSLDDTPIQFLNVPEGKNIRMLTNALAVTVFGKREAVQALTQADFSAVVDMRVSSLGTYAVRPTVSSEDVWVNYSDGGYLVYLSIS